MSMKIDTTEWHAANAISGPLAIEARGMVKRFDGFTAVDGIDLTVREGAIYGILGPNGAGKTTTLRMLLGIIEPDQGSRRILGADRPHDVAHAIGYLPEERGLYPAMKAYEAIAFLGALRGLPLALGYATQLNLFLPIAGQLERATVRVTGEEEITVPAGKFMTWAVDVDSGGTVSKLWFSQAAPNQLIKLIACTIKID